MKTKVRLFACVMAVVCCMTVFSVTAFADGYYESNENGDNTPPSSIDSITVSTESVELPENQGSEALTPDGNLSLIDDILQSDPYASDKGITVGDKQFITVQSKNGNYFYIVIDRSGDTENVYFLNLVDEADLMALMEDADSASTTCNCTDKCVAGNVNTACPLCKTNMSECVGKEVETSPKPDADAEPNTDTNSNADSEKSGNSSGLLLIVLVLALAGGGALYWFKFRKPKADTRGADDLDDYDYGYGEDEEDDENAEYVTEEDDEPENADTEDTDA